MSYVIMARGSTWVTPSLLCKKLPDSKKYTEETSQNMIHNNMVEKFYFKYYHGFSS